MFDRKSDYAQNKREKDAIVYIGVTGPVLLTRATFTSEDEFMKWKLWSDSDYHATEKTGRSYYDNSLPWWTSSLTSSRLCRLWRTRCFTSWPNPKRRRNAPGSVPS